MVTLTAIEMISNLFLVVVIGIFLVKNSMKTKIRPQTCLN